MSVKELLSKWNDIDWLEKQTLDQLYTERDNVFNNYYRNIDYPIETREKFEYVLELLDKRISKMESTGKPSGFSSYPREHGHNLFKPD